MASLLGYTVWGHDPAELRGVDEAHHAIARDKGPAVETALDPFVPLDSDGVVARAVLRGARLSSSPCRVVFLDIWRWYLPREVRPLRVPSNRTAGVISTSPFGSEIARPHRRHAKGPARAPKRRPVIGLQAGGKPVRACGCFSESPPKAPRAAGVRFFSIVSKIRLEFRHWNVPNTRKLMLCVFECEIYVAISLL